MKKTLWYSIASMVVVCAGIILIISGRFSDKDLLVSGFLTPPDSVKPGLYWYWMNEHVSKEGITKDLEAMKRIGIGEAFIGNIYEGGEPGGVKTMSEEWVECMRHAIREGSRLGVRISVFNAPGWSQSGGPWVDAGESMRYLTYSDTIVEGGAMLQFALSQPKKDFQQVAVMAIPMSESYLKPSSVRISTACEGEKHLFDGDKKSKTVFQSIPRGSVAIELTAAAPFLCRSMSLYPTGMGFDTECELWAWVDGVYVSVSKQFFDRSNTSLQLGPTPEGKLVSSFKGVISNRFKITMNNLPVNFELAEIELSDGVQIEKVTEKSLLKLPNTSNPSWSAYRWNTQATDADLTFLKPDQVVDITLLCSGGQLKWAAPKGRWRVLRFGMSPTYTTNTPAAPAAKGLEIDKLSQKASVKHFQEYVGKIISGMSSADKKSLHRIIVDSYEVGPQNWSDNYRERFMDKMKYDPMPYLPVLSGAVIGSVEISDRFLWDMRRVVADLVAEEYVGGLRKIANKHGMKLWLENYGHWGFPSEFLYYGSQADEVGGEFWAGSSPTAECKLAASSCHIYGKNEVFAESYTAGGNYFRWHPAALKQKGDWSYTEGVNSVILHVYIHQPYDERVPGVNAWFGIEFNRHNTWFEQAKGWVDYQRRCSFMLQQGTPVRDLCVFFGEDAPQMNYWIDPTLSGGYSFDLINGDAIINRLKVEKGQLVLPNGIRYAALLLPPLTTMRPELLSGIRRLIEEGAIVLASSIPEKSPSLQNYPQSDRQLTTDAKVIFPNPGETMKRTGKGALYTRSANDVLREINHPEDVSGIGDRPINWIHRTCDAGEIYFLTNQGDSSFEGNLAFRVKGLKPEFWNAVDGSMRPAVAYEYGEKSTTVKIRLAPAESLFVIFSDKEKSPQSVSLNRKEPSATILNEISSTWNIHFKNDALNQNFKVTSNALFDWKDSDDQRVKYFSGTAFYSTKFSWQSEKKKPVYIHFDEIHVVGTLRVNGKEIGSLWTPPYELEITSALKEGENSLEVEVANLWVNQLVSQYSLPVSQRSTWTLIDAARADQPLEPSGIKGKCYLFTK